MTPQGHMPDVTRRTRKTLYAVTAFYVGVGFFITVPAALSGDRLSAFLGFLIIGGALGGAAVINAVLRSAFQIQSVGERLDDIRLRLEQMEATYHSTQTTATAESPARLIDLATLGRGDPSVLVAARLDRDAFPRLVTTMEEEPPAEAAEVQPDGASDGAVVPEPLAQPSPGEPDDSGPPAEVIARNLLRDWNVGLRNGDVAACRAVYAALVDVADPNTVAALSAQLDELTDRTEASLRVAFAERYRERDFEGMLAVGARLCGLLPDRPVAEEFNRIKPFLLYQSAQLAAKAPPHPLRVVR